MLNLRENRLKSIKGFTAQVRQFHVIEILSNIFLKTKMINHVLKYILAVQKS